LRKSALHFWLGASLKKHGDHQAKTVVPVLVLGIVPVAVGAASIPAIVVEGAAAQHPVIGEPDPMQSG
jgi:tellurite resistance protein TehA-like permease